MITGKRDADGDNATLEAIIATSSQSTLQQNTPMEMGLGENIGTVYCSPWINRCLLMFIVAWSIQTQNHHLSSSL